MQESGADNMFRILIVDDHPLVRMGVVALLSRRLPESVITESDNAADAVAAVRNQPWDLVLLDLSLPGRSGLEVLEELKGIRQDLPVLILSAYPESQFAVRAFRSGAAGYLVKGCSGETLAQAVHELLEGRKFITPAVADQLAAEVNASGSKPLHQQLSSRELDIFLRLATGHSVSRIAEQLGISIKTVSTYRARVMAKTGFKNNAEMTQHMFRNNLGNFVQQ
jgi:two-component system invasion response regulator UvrY